MEPHLNSQKQAMQDTQGIAGKGTSSTTHKLSIAIPIGITIGVIGLILLLYGLFGTQDYQRTLNINVNLWWGLLMIILGLLLAGGNYLTLRRNRTRGPL